MKILISAFSCLPHYGSEPGVAWRWTLELAKQHEVVVITDATRRSVIELELARNPLSNVKFAFYRPVWLKRIPLNSTTATPLYSLWQYSLLPFARKLHRKHGFDLVIHLTYGVFRHPCFLGFLGPPFVFGPLGGGEDAPWSLKRSLPIQEKVREILRTVANRVSSFNPFLWMALSRATLVLVRTPETARRLPRPFSRSAVVQQEIGVDVNASRSAKQSKGTLNSPLKVLFVGRLLGWKGLHLALKAVHAASTAGYKIAFTVIGQGRCERWFRQISMELGMGDIVRWVNHLPQEVLLESYAEYDCLLFPSLHDSGGTVVLEAMASGLPIICLDLGGPPTLVSKDSAFVISTSGKSEEDVIQHLANALIELARSEPKRLAMSNAALRHAQGRSWSSVVAETLDKVYGRIGS